MVEIKEGEFYFLYDAVIHVSGIETDHSEGRSYAVGEELDLKTMEVRNFDSEGHQLSTVRLWNSGPLTEKQKKDVIAKFAEFRRKGVARKFFRM